MAPRWNVPPTLRTALKTHHSLLVVIAATLAGVSAPDLAAPLQPLIPALVAGLVFTAFYGLSLEEVTARDLSTPVLVSLGCLYLLVPVVLYPVASVVLSGELLLGVLVVLSAPLAAGSSIIWTRLGGGNTLLATVTVLVSMILAPVVMPTLIATFGDSAIGLSTTDLVVELGVIVLVAGALAYLVPDGTVSDRHLDGFSLATLGALIYVAVGGSTLSVSAIQLAFVATIAVAALCLSGLVAYALYTRGMEREECVTVLFASSMKNMSVAVMVGAVFGGGAIVAAITAFHVAQQIVSSTLVGRLESLTSSEPNAAANTAVPDRATDAPAASQPGD
ncbi:bile acid:sodium symporter family protein [Natrarchaeobaculum aegyptiacum]|uniref:bile acid:sodium symporter family protein n=1 Tax=Natrarchaeobaculum aegyptiacum TaxID=745377 RepID=UPI000A3D7360|nr:bile acid:sodium symporter [Natrarchaeobaculum aegyptiacum]